MTRGYPLRLTLTREMRIALNKLVAEAEEPKDFVIALKVFRAGLVIYDALDLTLLQLIYQRHLMGDEEVAFLMEKGLTTDFRAEPFEPIHDAVQVRTLHDRYTFLDKMWDSLTPENRKKYYEEALKHTNMTAAKKILKKYSESPE